jgi:hypothetical protein
MSLYSRRENSPIPTSMLPPALRAMVQSVAEVYHVPEVMPTVIALSMVSAALGKGLQIPSGRGRKTMGNLFVLVSADSGTGKSSVLRIMREPLEIIENHLRTFPSIQTMVPPEEWADSSEGFVGLVTPPGPEGAPGVLGRRSSYTESCPRQLICSEITGPALAKLLAENQETILNATAEAGNLLEESSRPNSPLGQLLLKGYSGDQVEIHRIPRKAVVLREPCITVCWLCQPHRLEKFLSSDRLLEDGLLARFCVVHSKAGMAYLQEDDRAVPVAASDSYGALINSLFDAYGQMSEDFYTAETTPDAQETLTSYYNRCVGRWHSDHGQLRSCIARWTEQAWKITLVLHAATHGGNSHRIAVDQQTAEDAVTLQEWFAEQQMEIIGGTTRQPQIMRLEKLCTLLREAPDHLMTLRNLHNSHGFSAEEVRRLVEQVPARLNLQKLQNPRGGPPSFVLSLTQSPL